MRDEVAKEGFTKVMTMKTPLKDGQEILPIGWSGDSKTGRETCQGPEGCKVQWSHDWETANTLTGLLL